MKKVLVSAVAWLALLLCGVAQAQGADRGQLMRVATRPGVVVPIYVVWNSRAVTSVVLFPGGQGGFGKIGADGWPSSDNFLVRTGKLWARQPFNVVMVGRPSDGLDLGEGALRISSEHAADNVAVFRAIKARSPLPLWVVGTSMGTISAAASAIHDKDGLIAGLVLTSSITSRRRVGAVPTQDLGAITVPTLVLHNEKDACKLCNPADARKIEALLVHAPVKKTIMLDGGSGARGDPCKALHYHGFVGMEDVAVTAISAWILHPGA